MTFKPRDPVIYTDGSGKRELGFVIECRSSYENVGEVAFCRFWHAPRGEAPTIWRLRTTSCSEICSVSDLTYRDYGASEIIRIVCDAMGWAM